MTLESSATQAQDEETLLAPPSARHAVWIMNLNMGSCGGCDQQVAALLAPRYQLTRRGIAFAASPRHADIVLLTGVLTRRSLAPVQRVLAQIPDPHAIIAVGDCVINGSVFAGSTELVPNAADLLGVNIEIAGNPPIPAQILLAIEEAARLLDDAGNGGAEEADAEESDEAESDANDEETDEELEVDDEAEEEKPK